MKYFRYTENLTEFENLKYTHIRPNVTYCTANEELSWKKYVWDNDVEYVDLGLPSGRLWATYDIGANAILGTGQKFAWGELSSKQIYEEQTYRWSKIGNEYEKYNSTDGKLVLDFEDDVARQILGGDWRIPSVADIQELIANTTWTTKNTSSGGNVFTSKINGHTITFLRDFGIWINEIPSMSKNMGRVWAISSSENSVYVDLKESSRYFGYNIRPVI